MDFALVTFESRRMLKAARHVEMGIYHLYLLCVLDFITREQGQDWVRLCLVTVPGFRFTHVKR